MGRALGSHLLRLSSSEGGSRGEGVERRELHMSRGKVSCCLGAYEESTLLSPLQTTCKLVILSRTHSDQPQQREGPRVISQQKSGCCISHRAPYLATEAPATRASPASVCAAWIPQAASPLPSCAVLDTEKEWTSLRMTTPRPLLGTKQHSRHLSKHP